MSNFKNLDELIPHIEDAFKLFYDAMLNDVRLSVFFNNQEQVNQLILRQKQHFKASLSMDKELIKKSYIKLGEFHHDLRIPYVDFIKGTNILEEYFLLHTQKIRPSMELMDEIFTYFKVMKSFTAKGYLNRMIGEDKKDLEDFFNYSSNNQNNSTTKCIAMDKLLWLKDMLHSIETDGDFDYKEGALLLDKWLDEIKFIEPEKRKFFEDLESRIMLNSQNLFYFLKREEYLEILPLYTSLLSIYKLTLMMNNAMTLEYANKMIGQMQLDNLTGLYRKDLFEDLLNKEISVALRHNYDFCLLYIDLDDFKMINDNYGHYSGDKVIQSLGEIIRNAIRSSDLAFRNGGDEFAIILKGAKKEEAKKVAQKIKVDFSSLEFIFNEEKVFSVSLSIGINEFDNTQSYADVIKFADEKLYEAKNQGKNQIV